MRQLMKPADNKVLSNNADIACSTAFENLSLLFFLNKYSFWGSNPPLEG